MKVRDAITALLKCDMEAEIILWDKDWEPTGFLEKIIHQTQWPPGENDGLLLPPDRVYLVPVTGWAEPTEPQDNPEECRRIRKHAVRGVRDKAKSTEYRGNGGNEK